MFTETTLMPATYLCYVAIGVSLTIWVSHTLRIRGRVFLDKGCQGNEELAESLSHLFSVGFYLLHIGFVLLTLKLGGAVFDAIGAIELLSTKVGVVLLVLGVSHLLHIAMYVRIHGKPRSPTKPFAATAEVIDP